jgi:hypothetical protein
MMMINHTLRGADRRSGERVGAQCSTFTISFKDVFPNSISWSISKDFLQIKRADPAFAQIYLQLT